MKLTQKIQQADIPVTFYVFSCLRVILAASAIGCIYAAFHMPPFQISNLLMFGMGCYVLWMIWKEIPDIIKAFNVRRNKL